MQGRCRKGLTARQGPHLSHTKGIRRLAAPSPGWPCLCWGHSASCSCCAVLVRTVPSSECRCLGWCPENCLQGSTAERAAKCLPVSLGMSEASFWLDTAVLSDALCTPQRGASHLYSRCPGGGALHVVECLVDTNSWGPLALSGPFPAPPES